MRLGLWLTCPREKERKGLSLENGFIKGNRSLIERESAWRSTKQERKKRGKHLVAPEEIFKVRHASSKKPSFFPSFEGFAHEREKTYIRYFLKTKSLTKPRLSLREPLFESSLGSSCF